jgi:O-methyltransferase
MFRLFARGTNYILGDFLQKQKVFIGNSLLYLNRSRVIDKNYFDHIRLSTLELVSSEINRNNLVGNVAELGVYKGKFARYINLYFSKRKLYLFDTFTGFDDRDIDKDKKEDCSSGSQIFADTSIESVMKQMPFPHNCIPIQGFFPQSAREIDDKFVFVSLDADLYEPIYAGLNFFYPNLVKGGYIFIHDFNNESYKGSRKAVEQFCSEQNINFVPIPDACGTAIITK